MTNDQSSSEIIESCLVRIRAGDETARQDLIRAAQDRLRRLARRMLSDFPGVHRFEDTDDVFQNAMMRLCRTMDRVIPDSVTSFVQIAARDMRCTLIDLARHYYGPQGAGAHRESIENSSELTRMLEQEVSDDAARLAFWSEFHQKVQLLPDDLRQIMDFLWYQGMTHSESARLLGISERTVQRRWRQACLLLHDNLADLPPGFV